MLYRGHTFVALPMSCSNQIDQSREEARLG